MRPTADGLTRAQSSLSNSDERPSQGRYAVDPTYPALQQLDGAEALRGTSTLFLVVRLCTVCRTARSYRYKTLLLACATADVGWGRGCGVLRRAMRYVMLCWVCTKMDSRLRHSRTYRFVDANNTVHWNVPHLTSHTLKLLLMGWRTWVGVAYRSSAPPWKLWQRRATKGPPRWRWRTRSESSRATFSSSSKYCSPGSWSDPYPLHVLSAG